jgi:hypothetical protein
MRPGFKMEFHEFNFSKNAAGRGGVNFWDGAVTPVRKAIRFALRNTLALITPIMMTMR